MAFIKYKINDNEVAISLYEKLDIEKAIRVKAGDKTYYAGLTSNLSDSSATALRIKVGDTIYAFLKSKPPIILSDSKYRMKDIYPGECYFMETISDTFSSEDVTTMENMFNNCKSLTSIPQLDTSNVTNMKNMFNGCEKLRTIPQLDTSKVTDMRYMFKSCSSLPKEFPWVIDLSAMKYSEYASSLGNMFTGSSVTKVKFKNGYPIRPNLTPSVLKSDGNIEIEYVVLNIELKPGEYEMSYLYPNYYCAMETVPDNLVGSENLTDMSRMFYNCQALTEIPKLDTSKVTDMGAMFRDCHELTSIPQLDTSKVTDMYSMFENCTSLPKEFPWVIDCSSITDATWLTNMFKGSSVTKVKFKNVKEELKSKITSKLLKGDDSLTIEFVKPIIALTDDKYKMSEIYPDTYKTMTEVPNELDTSEVTNMNDMFGDCTKLTAISEMDTSKVTNMNVMFWCCGALTTVPQLNTSNVTDMRYMFYKCGALTTVPQLNTSNVTDMYSMFNGCTALTTVPQLDTSKVTNMQEMFKSCIKLTSIPQLDTSNVTDMGAMFRDCHKLTAIPQLDTSKATNMKNMFNGCEKLTTIPQLDTSKATDMSDMFNSCSSLPKEFPWIIDCSSITDVENMEGMFRSSSVTKVKLKNVSNSIKSKITSPLLKGSYNYTLAIEFV